MKKLAILSVTFLLMISALQIQALNTKNEAEKASINTTKKEAKAEKKELRKLEGAEVNTLSKSSFLSDFGNVSDVVWQRSEVFDEVTFTKEGKTETAFYDPDAKLVGTTSVKTFDDLPYKGQLAIKKMYKDYKTGPVVFFNDNEANETDMLLYGIQFDDADNYFVELQKENSKIIVRVNTAGQVFLFKQLQILRITQMQKEQASLACSFDCLVRKMQSQ